MYVAYIALYRCGPPLQQNNFFCSRIFIKNIFKCYVYGDNEETVIWYYKQK